jgi:hypothetical protein
VSDLHRHRPTPTRLLTRTGTSRAPEAARGARSSVRTRLPPGYGVARRRERATGAGREIVVLWSTILSAALAVEMPDVVLQHCLYGIGPDAVAVEAWSTVAPVGYELTLEGAHALRFAGFRSGDLVLSVNGHPIGTAEALAAARAATADARRCEWVVRRGRGEVLLTADLVDWPEPRAAEVAEDGTVRVSRSAIAAGLTNPYRRPKRLFDTVYEGGVQPSATSYLGDVLTAAGMSDVATVLAFDGTPIETVAALEAAFIALLLVDRATFRVSSRKAPARDVVVVPSGPMLGPPPDALEGEPIPPRGLDVRVGTLAPLIAALQGCVTESAPHGERALQHRARTGEYDGLRISAVHRRVGLSEYGLLNGDVIRAISGVPTTSEQAFVQAAAALAGAEEVVLEIDRGGFVVTYRYRTGP